MDLTTFVFEGARLSTNYQSNLLYFLDMICLAPVSKPVSKENNPLILFYFEYSSGYLYRDLLLKKINTVLKMAIFISTPTQVRASCSPFA